MAHREKYNRQQSGHLLEHDCREPHDRDRGNPDIDASRTHLNYDLMEQYRNGQTAKERLDEITEKYAEIFRAKHGRQMRSDAVNMCSWVVTVPEDVPESEHREFFRHTLDFMIEKYGLENLITATVHNDETTPHCHYGYAPVVVDKKYANDDNPDFRKKLCQRNSEMGTLDKFQRELQKYLEEKMGHSVSILNGATADGNKTVKQLKADTQKKNEEAQQLLERLRSIEIAEEYRQRALAYYMENPEPPVEPKKPKIHYGKVHERYQEELKAYQENMRLYETAKAILIDEGIAHQKQQMETELQEQKQKQVEEYQENRLLVIDAKIEIDELQKELDKKQESIKLQTDIIVAFKNGLEKREQELQDREQHLIEREQNLNAEMEQRVERQLAERLERDERHIANLQRKSALIESVKRNCPKFQIQNQTADNIQIQRGANQYEQSGYDDN